MVGQLAFFRFSLAFRFIFTIHGGGFPEPQKKAGRRHEQRRRRTNGACGEAPTAETTGTQQGSPLNSVRRFGAGKGVDLAGGN